MFSISHQYLNDAIWFLQAVAGYIFIVHGMPKVKNPAGFASAVGFPKWGGMLQGMVEIVGGVMLILNFYAQLISLIFGLIMIGAIYFKIFKWKVPFKSHGSTGWEFDAILLAVFVLLACIK